MEKIITLDESNIDNEHICCAFSDKKCTEGYRLKKVWLKEQFINGYVFRRIDARAKVFIEYGPAEKSWVPVEAPDYLMINCFCQNDWKKILSTQKSNFLKEIINGIIQFMRYSKIGVLN